MSRQEHGQSRSVEREPKVDARWSARLSVTLNEVVGVREVARNLPRLLRRLAGGDVGKLVVTRRGKPVAVVVSVVRYEWLLNGWGGALDRPCPTCHVPAGMPCVHEDGRSEPHFARSQPGWDDHQPKETR